MSKDARPQLPSGNSPRMFFARCLWWCIWGGRFPFRDTDTVKVDNSGGFYSFTAKTSRQGISGWHFESKIEMNNTNSYPAQTIIHIQPTHDLVVTGIRDAANPTGPLVTSCAGYWISTQAVSAKKTVGGNDVWNLPQDPYPDPTDLDNPANFWIYLGEMNC